MPFETEVPCILVQRVPSEQDAQADAGSLFDRLRYEVRIKIHRSKSNRKINL